MLCKNVFITVRKGRHWLLTERYDVTSEGVQNYERIDIKELPFPLKGVKKEYNDIIHNYNCKRKSR